jgi:hypothetical protein
MSAPPIGDHQKHAEQQRQADEDGEQLAVRQGDERRGEDQHCGAGQRCDEDRHVHHLLGREHDRPRRHQLLQLGEGDDAGGAGQEAQQHLGHQRPEHEAVRRQGGRQFVVFGHADQADRECAEGVADRGALRDRGHRHQVGQRHADRGTQQHGDEDQVIGDHLVLQQGSDHGQSHADLPRPHAAARGLGAGHPHQREDEQRGGDQVSGLNERFGVHLIRPSCGTS